ncbi:hypothetical protein Efla_004331 [Eimeria flavescens]
MERLGKIENRPLMESLLLFFRELSCNFRPTEELIQQQEKELELQHLQQQEEQATAFGKPTDSDQEEDFRALEQIERTERKRRERPLKVAEMPPDVVTSALSDEQYAVLPKEARHFANEEVVSGQQRLTAYIKFLEQALQDREEELQVQRQELGLIESRMQDDKEGRYRRKR